MNLGQQHFKLGSILSFDPFMLLTKPIQELNAYCTKFMKFHTALLCTHPLFIYIPNTLLHSLKY